MSAIILRCLFVTLTNSIQSYCYALFNNGKQSFHRYQGIKLVAIVATLCLECHSDSKKQTKLPCFHGNWLLGSCLHDLSYWPFDMKAGHE